MTRLGIVTGMVAEADCFRDAPSLSSALVFCAGGSCGRAEAGACELIRRGATALVSFGIAGGLDPELRTGDIVVARSVLSPAGEIFPTHPAWTASVAGRLAASSGSVVTLDQAASTPASKRSLRQRTGASVVDMESSGVAAAAAKANLPFIVIRAVADPADRRLPRSALAGLAPDGNTRPLAVLAALAIRPWELVALVALAGVTSGAMRSLRRVAALDLGFPAEGLLSDV